MQRKSFDIIETKADGDSGEFTAIVSVFGNVDLVGDRMLPGSFEKTISEWRASGDPIPVILSHQWDDPMMHIGAATPDAVRETEKGLEVSGTLDVQDNPVAAQVHRLLKTRRLKGWSFGFTVPDGAEKRKDGANEISEVDLIEVGPTLKGANPEAETTAIKSLVAEVDDAEIRDPELAKDVAAVKAMPDEDSETPSKSQAQGPLKKRSMEVVADLADTDSAAKSKRDEEPETKADPPDVAELRRRSREVVLDLFS